MADYSTVLNQSRRVAALGQASQAEVTERNAQRLAAYRWLATQAPGQTILDDLALVLLRPCLTPEDEGERRMVLKIFAAVREGGQADG